MEGEPPREGAVAREEFFVLEELIQLSLASGKELKEDQWKSEYRGLEEVWV